MNKNFHRIFCWCSSSGLMKNKFGRICYKQRASLALHNSREVLSAFCYHISALYTHYMNKWNSSQGCKHAEWLSSQAINSKIIQVKFSKSHSKTISIQLYTKGSDVIHLFYHSIHIKLETNPYMRGQYRQ